MDPICIFILLLMFSFSTLFARFWLLPQPILKRRIMGKRPLDSNTPDKSIQESIEFMNLSLESLTQKELASRLTLNCSNSYVKPQLLQETPITIIDVSSRTGANLLPTALVSTALLTTVRRSCR